MQATNAPWQLAPPSASSRAWLLVLTTLLPLVITVVALGFAAASESSANLIADSWSITFVVTLLGVGALGAAIGVVVMLATRRHHVVVDADGIEVTTTFYKRRLGWSELKLDEARVVNIDERTEFKPALKTNGANFPGFRSGWFRLRNREKALVATADNPRVTYIPTTRDFALVLQPRSPQALLDHLRSKSPS